MISEKYIQSVSLVFWGYLFIYFNINLGPIDVFPGWAGYIFLVASLRGIAELEPSAKLLTPFALLLVAQDLLNCAARIVDVTLDFYWIDVVLTVVGLYFHFQLLTNLAQIAERQHSIHNRAFRWLRNCQTVLQTILAFLPITKNLQFEYAGINLVTFLIGATTIILLFAIMGNLHGYKKELIEMNETWINRPPL